MGTHPNIGFDKFPKQGSYLKRRVRVCFHYDTSQRILGTIVRDDAEEPGRLLIKLDDGRHVDANECQYSLVKEPEPEPEPVVLGVDVARGEERSVKGWRRITSP